MCFAQDDCTYLHIEFIRVNVWTVWKRHGVRSGPEDMKFAIKSAKSMGLSKVQLESAS